MSALAAGICALYLKRFSGQRLWQDRNAHRQIGDAVLFLVTGPRHALSVFPPRQCTHKAACDTVPAPLPPPRNVALPHRATNPPPCAACVRTRKRACACARVQRDLLSLDATGSIQPLRPWSHSFIQSYFPVKLTVNDNKRCVFNAPDFHTQSVTQVHTNSAPE